MAAFTNEHASQRNSNLTNRIRQEGIERVKRAGVEQRENILELHFDRGA